MFKVNFLSKKVTLRQFTRNIFTDKLILIQIGHHHLGDLFVLLLEERVCSSRVIEFLFNYFKDVTPILLSG